MDTTRATVSQPTDALGPISERLTAWGKLCVARITKSLRSVDGELVFAAAPARAGTVAKRIVVRFVDSIERPAPRMDASTGTIELYYPRRDHPEVQQLLNSKKDRFCYFWESAHGKQAHAWILSSP
ncbi:MAG TPA: hypothetical protein PKY96_11190 [Flavobacteriales bacterium]|nr:hypothetical protein [Flavobacteriales bacterium]